MRDDVGSNRRIEIMIGVALFVIVLSIAVPELLRVFCCGCR
jgi:hypothetical protein